MPSHFITVMKQVYCPHVIVLTTPTNMTIPNGIFSKKGLYILYLNVNSLLPKTDEICFIAKKLSALVIRISESKLDPSILNSEVDIVGYNIINRSRRGGGVACYIKNLLIIKSQVFILILKAFLQTFFCPNQSQFW